MDFLSPDATLNRRKLQHGVPRLSRTAGMMLVTYKTSANPIVDSSFTEPS